MKLNYFFLMTVCLVGCDTRDDKQQRTKAKTTPDTKQQLESKAGYPTKEFSVEKKDAYSPYVGRDYPDNVYFGDTHLHTALSLDAYPDGNKRNGPDEAYRWAKGEVIAGDDGVPTRISKPLDFLMVADHAEYIGYIKGLADHNKSLRATETGKRCRLSSRQPRRSL
jgi:hypothetical protein